MTVPVNDLDGAPLPVLLELLSSADPHERADAACSLGDRLRTRELTTLERADADRLAALLADAVPLVRFECAIALAELHDSRALGVLTWGLQRANLRLDAVRALGRLGDARAIAPLSRLLGRWLLPWADRLQAAAALCALGDAASAAYLRRKVDSYKLPERAAAVHFIAEAHHPEARALLVAMVTDTTHPMRDVAVRALGTLGDPSTRPVLEAARQGALEDAELLADIDAALAELHKG